MEPGLSKTSTKSDEKFEKLWMEKKGKRMTRLEKIYTVAEVVISSIGGQIVDKSEWIHMQRSDNIKWQESTFEHKIGFMFEGIFHIMMFERRTMAKKTSIMQLAGHSHDHHFNLSSRAMEVKWQKHVNENKLAAKLMNFCKPLLPIKKTTSKKMKKSSKKGKQKQ